VIIPDNTKTFMGQLAQRNLSAEEVQQELLFALSQSLAATDRYCMAASRHQAEASWYRREAERLQQELDKPWWSKLWPF
jgi:hypothetical protein